MKTSSRLGRLQDSPTLAVAAKAAQLAASGRDIISLAVGEPDFPTPPHIVEAAKKAMDEGQTRYTPAAGTWRLRAAVAHKLRQDAGVVLEPAQVVVTTGAKQALFNLFQALLDPGDQVLVPRPYWVSYPAQVKLAGGEPVFYDLPTPSSPELDLDALESRIGPRCRAILLNNPNNPTGGCLSRREIEAIADMALRHDLAIVSDEIYRDLLYEGEPPLSPGALAPEVAARTFTVDGVSKAYSMTGWRIGWVGCGDRDVARAVIRLQSHSTSNACSVAQAAALAAITQPRDFQEGWRREFDRRRRALVEGLDRLPGVACTMPQGAFYAFPSITGLLGPQGRGIRTADELAIALLEEAGVAVVPGPAFGVEGHIRLSYALAYDRLVDAMHRFESFVMARAA